MIPSLCCQRVIYVTENLKCFVGEQLANIVRKHIDQIISSKTQLLFISNTACEDPRTHMSFISSITRQI